MKYLILFMVLLTINGCASTAMTETVRACDPNKRETVFASKKIEVNKSLSSEGEIRLVVKSYQEPTVVRSPSTRKITFEGMQNYSIAGYHTNECGAVKARAGVEEAKASVGYKVERKGGNIYVTTTGEWRFIHHQTAFASIKITLPEGMVYQYIHTPLKRPAR